MKTAKRFTLFLLLLALIAGCKKENEDYRAKYLGAFGFTTIIERWVLGESIQYDTVLFDGEIRRFIPSDSENDLYIDNDAQENPQKKITITFLVATSITPTIGDDGELEHKTGYHYLHDGKFIDRNTIEFSVRGLGGLGGGTNYTVKGIRR